MYPKSFVRCCVVAAMPSLLLLSGCAQLNAYMPGAGHVLVDEAISRGSEVGLSPAVVDQLGGWAAELWVQQYRVVRDKPENQIVDAVMGGVIAAAKQSAYAKAAEKMKWDVMVVDDPNIDAVALPGGKVIVCTGLTTFAKGNRETLAVALTHEVVHALARHPAERISKELRDEIVLEYSSGDILHRQLSPGATAGVMAAMGLAYHGVEAVPFARTQEDEADHTGLLLMGYAKYNPQVAVDFWKERMKQSKTRMPEFLQMHRSDETRIAQLQAWMPQALQLFQQARLSPPAAGAGV